MWHRREWFQVPGDSDSQGLSIIEKYLIPIVLAEATLGKEWRNNQIICHCDNMAVVSGLRSHYSKEKGAMHLLCCLIFVEAFYGFVFEPQYNYVTGPMKRALNAAIVNGQNMHVVLTAWIFN